MLDFLHANLSYFLSGISVGGQYALSAIGYTMVYGILRLINFAHGDVFMVAGLMMVYVITSYSIHYTKLYDFCAALLFDVVRQEGILCHNNFV